MSAVAGRLPSEVASVVGKIDPDAYSTGTVTTSWVSAADFQAYMAEVAAGDLGTNATIDAKIEQATDDSGTGVKDLSGSAITQLTDADSDSNQQVLINFRPENMDVQGGFTHFRLSLTVGTATSDAAGTVYGFEPRYGPATDQDASTVDEVVTV